jgi:predicted Zn-dependent protease
MRSRFDEARFHLRIAQGLDPFSARQKSSYASFLYYSRRYEEANEYYSRPELYGPLPIEAMLLRALTEIESKRFAEALELIEALQSNVGASLLYRSTILEINARCGRMKDGMIEEAADLFENNELSYFRKASLALAFDDRARSLDLLRASLREHEAEFPWVMTDPRFDSLRSDAGYLLLIPAMLKGKF